MISCDLWLVAVIDQSQSDECYKCFLMASSKRLKLSEDASCSTSEEKKTKTHFNPATSDFGEVVESDDFVDKSLLIKAIFDEDAKMVLITAPRRFGKSTNMDMVKTFVEVQVDATGAVIEKKASSNYTIFEKNQLLIFCQENKEFFDNHFATYPVIHTIFKNVTGCSFDQVVDEFRSVLHETFEKHSYLLNSDKLSSQEISAVEEYYGQVSFKNLTISEVKNGLKFLSKCLYKHFNNKKVFVLIDEYDAPINNAMFEENIDITKVNKLLSSMFSETLKGNDYVERALLTGISYFATVGLSAMNNIGKYMFLDNDQFVNYYGLVEHEVDELLSKFKIDQKVTTNVKSFYNGYNCKNGVQIFSLWSMLNYLKNKELKSYWQKSGLAIGLASVLHVSIVRNEIEKLLHDIPVHIDKLETIRLEHVKTLNQIIHSKDVKLTNAELYLTFLLQQGYLTYVWNGNEPDERYQIKIPNAEIYKEFRIELKEYYSKCVDKFLDACAVVINGISPRPNIYNELITTFQQVIREVKEGMIFQNERIFHSYLFSVICKTQFCIADEMSLYTNRRRLDLFIHNYKIGIIFEIKYKQSAEIALKQIIEKKYYEIFNNTNFENLQHKIYVGLNVSEDLKVTLAVLVDNIDITNTMYFPMNI